MTGFFAAEAQRHREKLFTTEGAELIEGTEKEIAVGGVGGISFSPTRHRSVIELRHHSVNQLKTTQDEKMAETGSDHERRIATIEGEMKSVATKADLANLETGLTRSVQDTINAQTQELKEALKEQSGEIRELREKDSRMRGIGDTLKVVAPFIVSIVAVLVAILK